MNADVEDVCGLTMDDQLRHLPLHQEQHQAAQNQHRPGPHHRSPGHAVLGEQKRYIGLHYMDVGEDVLDELEGAQDLCCCGGQVVVVVDVAALLWLTLSLFGDELEGVG